MPIDETSQPIELLLSVVRDGGRTLGAQIEDQLRDSIRSGALHPDAPIPSTRDLARQLGVSRRVVVDAYAQLAAEGYLLLRQGARPRVSGSATAPARSHDVEPRRVASRIRYDFRPSVPDVSGFPRQAWLRSLRHAVTTIPDADLAYGDPLGVMSLRSALAEYLGRVRGVVAEPDQVVITNGYTQSLGLVCRALARAGRRRIALEDPSNPEDAEVAARAGLEPLSVPVDGAGVQLGELERAGADAVVVTPAHQHPTGVVMTGERRAELLAWLRQRSAVAIEDDYDAEYRYDRVAVGALQGLAPEHVAYIGSASKRLAPGMRLGWMLMPSWLTWELTSAKAIEDGGSEAIGQLALRDFIVRGELDRHVRRMRLRYQRRRETLLAALTRWLPEGHVSSPGAAGLFELVMLPEEVNEHALLTAAAARGVGVEGLALHSFIPGGAPGVLLGYGNLSEPAIEQGVRLLGEAYGEVSA